MVLIFAGTNFRGNFFFQKNRVSRIFIFAVFLFWLFLRVLIFAIYRYYGNFLTRIRKRNKVESTKYALVFPKFASYSVIQLFWFFPDSTNTPKNIWCEAVPEIQFSRKNSRVLIFAVFKNLKTSRVQIFAVLGKIRA